MEAVIRIVLEIILLAINLRETGGLHSSRGTLRLGARAQASMVCISRQALAWVTLCPMCAPLYPTGLPRDPFDRLVDSSLAFTPGGWKPQHFLGNLCK